MKIIVAGSRWVPEDRLDLVEDAIKLAPFSIISEVVSGGNKTWDSILKLYTGVDWLGEMWAKKHGLPIKQFPAEWKKYGAKAGPMRNEAMAHYGDRLIALWDGESKGTKNMIDCMKVVEKPFYIYYVRKEDIL